MWTLDDEETLEFDFEKYLGVNGITLDENGKSIPNSRLPGGGAAAAAKRDIRRGTVVCRHWLRGLCMKGDGCEFLHQYDMTKMPECRWGMTCQVIECPFRHVPDEERSECAFYKHGFCIHGPICRYRHTKLPREDCPEKAEFDMSTSANNANEDDGDGTKRRKTEGGSAVQGQGKQDLFKVAICKHWEKSGSCPFNDECHFAHGKHELRSFPQKNDDYDLPGGGGGGQSSTATASRAPLPDTLCDGQSLYYLVYSASYMNVANCIEKQKWALPSHDMSQIQAALRANLEIAQVFLFFSVLGSHHIQGVAKATRSAIQEVNSASCSTDLFSTSQDVSSDAFSVEWCRVSEVPTHLLMDLQAQAVLETPPAPAVQIGPDSIVGRIFMEAVYDTEEVALNTSIVNAAPEGQLQSPQGIFEFSVRRYQEAERAAGKLFMLRAAPQLSLASPGFLVACNNATFDECFGRLMFGLPAEHENSAVSSITVGTPLFLLNMSDRHLLGVFQATTPAIMNQDPTAFTRGPNTPSPFPLQIRFSVLYEAPAVSENDPLMLRTTGDRQLRIGPLSLELTQRLAQTFARHSVLKESESLVPRRSQQQQHQSHGRGRGGNNMMRSGGNFEESVPVGIENDNDFSVSRRIIGPSGANMKKIIQGAGGHVSVKLRGRGSSSQPNPRDQDQPLSLLVSADSAEKLQIAVQLTHDLLGRIHRDYEDYRGRGHRDNHQQRSSRDSRSRSRRSPSGSRNRSSPGRSSRR